MLHHEWLLWTFLQSQIFTIFLNSTVFKFVEKTDGERVNQYSN